MMSPQTALIRRLRRQTSSFIAFGTFVALSSFVASCASSDGAVKAGANSDATSDMSLDSGGGATSGSVSSDTGAAEERQGLYVGDSAAESSNGLAGQPAPEQDAAAAGADAQPTGSDASAMRDAPLFAGIAKIMVLGSSNESGTCWRAFLWQKLRSAGITSFDFVGSQVVGPDCGVAGYNKACEARPGTIVTGISAATYKGWFAAHPPDIVLQHIGGADLMSNITAANVIKAYSVIVEQARAVNPKVIFLVAQHTPQDPPGCGNCIADVVALNSAIPGWAAQTTTTESPVSVVDLYTGLDSAADFSDRVHLNVSGSQKVSDRWMAALLPILKP
jgi:hypothetical protein